MTISHPKSFQLYSSRNFPTLDTQLETIAKIGFTNVEPYRQCYEDVPALRAGLDRFGLTAVSGQMDVPALLQETDACMRLAETLGLKILVAPFLPQEICPTTEAGWETLAEDLDRTVRLLKRNGYELIWHNHDFELTPLPSGRLPLDMLLSTGMGWEADVAWIARAGGDPLAMVAQYAAKLRVLHLKDLARPGEHLDEDGWADPGQGVVDLAALWRLADRAGAEAVIAEHDNPSDYVRFAQTAHAFMEARLAETEAAG